MSQTSAATQYQATRAERNRARWSVQKINLSELKRCSKCRESFPKLFFRRNRCADDGLDRPCLTCSRMGERDRLRDPEKLRRKRESIARCQKSHPETRRAWRQRRSKELREAVISHYGGRCADCGYADPRALCIDHVNGDGSQDRKLRHPMMRLLLHIIQAAFPKSYQVLCANCNMIKAREKKEYGRKFKERGGGSP